MKYTVQRGDTLWLIAKRFGISLNDLIAANPQIANPDRIDINDVITIPLTGVKPDNDYVVKKGDTMWLIAKKFGVTLDDLIAANPQITDPNRINVGDVIHLPETDMEENDTENSGINKKNKKTSMINIEPIKTEVKSKEQMKPAQSGQISHVQQNNIPNKMYYVVKTGDTLLKIAKLFGVSLQKLLEENKHIENPDKIYPGNKIKVPVDKDYMEKKYNPPVDTPTQPEAIMPIMPEMQMKTPEVTLPEMQKKMPGTTPAMPSGMQTKMPGTTPAQPMPGMQGKMPLPGTTPAMPPMHQNCPMMHHCMQMIQMMLKHPMQMHMMAPMHHMEQEQMSMGQFPCFGMDHDKKDDKCKHQKKQSCKHKR
ncbi:MAG: LysM peptidoglycan-binding domain-containing protein [Bacillota bacterium]